MRVYIVAHITANHPNHTRSFDVAIVISQIWLISILLLAVLYLTADRVETTLGDAAWGTMEPHDGPESDRHVSPV